MISYVNFQVLPETGDTNPWDRIGDYFRNHFQKRNGKLTYIVRRLPINEYQVFKELFPRESLVDEPEEFIQRKLLVIDAKFHQIRYYHKLAQLLNSRGIHCGIVTEMPYSIEDNIVELLEPFNFCFFFDQYHLSKYPYARIAADKAIEMIREGDLAVYPKLAGLGYLELKINAYSEPLALLALTTDKESYIFCEPVTKEARKTKQFMSLIACPRYLEVKAQEATQNSIIVQDNTENIKLTRIYWLTVDQFVEQVNQRQPIRF